LRLPTFALAAVLALASLTACSDDGGSDDSSGDETSQTPSADQTDSGAGELTQAQLDQALLTAANLSDEFEVDAAEDDENDDSDEPDLGCLFAFEDDEDDEDDDDEGEIAFSAKQEPGLPGILHFLAVAPDEDAAERGLDEITDELDDCERVDTQDDDGTRWQLDVELDRTNWAENADDQVNLSAVGTLGMDSLELPLTIELSVVRVANGVSITAFFDISDDIGSAHQDVTDAAAGRLAAVLAGDEPPRPEPVLDGYPIGELFGEVTEDPEIEV
jgi:hypothetical protein